MSQGLLEAGRALASSSAGVSRRTFLKFGVTVGAAAGGGLLLGFSVPAAAQAAHRAGVRIGDAPSSPSAGVFAPNAFIRIDRQGLVTLIMPKVEMGQGVYTAIPMLIAEELEVPLQSVALDHAPPNAKLYGDPLLGGGQLTGGSTSIRYAWQPMREAGAIARVLLVAAAAQRWKVDAATCRAEQGTVVHIPSGRRIGYGELVDTAAKMPVPAEVKLKSPAQFTLVGKPTNRLDSPQKVDGSARFGFDVHLPGMRYAAIVHCPVLGGTLASVDEASAKKVGGVRQVVKLNNAVAVVGDHTWAAKSGAAALDVKWNGGEGATLSTKDIVDDLASAAQKDGALAHEEGDARHAFATAKHRIDAVYEQPFLAHATMEPMNCTVHVRPDGCEIWVGTQVPGFAAQAAQKATGLPLEKITVHNHLIGGGFGRRLEVDMIAQAVEIGKQVDAPVKVFWTREEDVQHDMYRPYYYDRISAGLDDNGRPIAWQHRIVGSSILSRFAPGAVANGVDSDAVEVAAELPYAIPNQWVDYVRQEPRTVPTAFWRGVGATRGTFVVESFIDELAAQARIDPAQYRRDLLKDKSPRAANVLEVATRAAGWGEPLPKGEGRGVSVMHAFGSYLSMVAQVAVDSDGQVTVKRVVCAVDCGMTVNPKTVQAQIEGGVVFGISAVLYGEITLKDGRVEQSNFTDYRVLRMNETPPIEVHLVQSTEAPGGIGEPGTAALAPAVTNAIFAATGTRVRKLPVAAQLKRA
ncbi:xanthine dehydrogenase family protein molybdopterin-binding subunit [Trinickia diaoshuihuensis]|uniref:xanthine dehydrogenase family protein molybdopterin-binding subunit n=1 Tax=Trinickia diaoshuihuensis TaxID=2292265 RepID=UPI000E264B3F|nr:xanthine dehydrogenase family protein molybdopterin-binding subunit [Trinickia diaoshuihuensis]